MLSIDDFDAFFHEVHGVDLFPWQKRLLRYVVEKGRWPDVLDLPTGAGKTAAIDIALFHLALECGATGRRRAPVRIAFVVDRRLVVDDAFARARKIEAALADAPGAASARVAAALRELAGSSGRPVIARRLRGGIPREEDWARTPAQPTILCSTVDQVGSRLLFRGYGISDSMKPVHAGLLGADCLIFLDEAHLAEPFRQTLGWVETYRNRKWREVDDVSSWGVALLTATPGAPVGDVFSLAEDDLRNPVLRQRLDARKPARLVMGARGRRNDSADGENEPDSDQRDLSSRVAALVSETTEALRHFTTPNAGVMQPAVGVVVNRVARARAVYDALQSACQDADVRLLIGPARPVERDEIAAELAAIRTGAERALRKPLIIVSTQCIEVGVDIDLDALITEAAPLDALRQRFGRLNRGGRPLQPYAAVVAWKSEISGRYEDPVYGKAIKAAWDLLDSHANNAGRQKVVDFGVRAFDVPLDQEALSPRDNAPVLLPAHLDLLGQTSPIPAADPEIGLFLHGSEREPDAVTVVWRADIDPTDPPENVQRLLTLFPPRAGEAIELPLWAVRRWLRRGRDSSLSRLADVSTVPPDDSDERRTGGHLVFCWKGDDERSRWIGASAIRPGDTVVVPAAYSGVDNSGWNPEHGQPAVDVGAKAANAFAGRRYAVRVAPGLVGEISEDALANALAEAESERWNDLRAALLDLNLPPDVRESLHRLDMARKRRVVPYMDVYPTGADGRVRGIVFLAPLGLEDDTSVDVNVNTTEDDAAGSLPGFQVKLDQHSRDVSVIAEKFARAAGLAAARVLDVKVAGVLHDAGKLDPRFQAWLHHGDPIGPDPTEAGSVLAKSGRELPRTARKAAGLPDYWRHEALSVRLAQYAPAFGESRDPELVLWLIGSHHGHGRVLFPHYDPADAVPRQIPPVLGLPSTLPAGAGPQSLAFDWNGADWPTLHARVRARYGIWELARMEAILRLADHRASEQEALREEKA